MLAAATTLPLAACGVRFESDAPSFLPSPSPDPAGPAILDERARVARVLQALPDAPARLRSRLEPLHLSQLAALDAALAALDPPVPAPARASRPAPTGTGGPAPTPAPAAALRRLAEAEGAALDPAGLARLDLLLPRAAGVVLASHAQRAVLLEFVPAPGTRSPVPDRVPWHAATPEIAARLVEDLRSAAYGLEVGAAHLEPARRTPVLACLRVLRDAETHLGLLVEDLPPRPLGYRLPRPVRTDAEALGLTTGVLDRLVASVLALSVPSAVARREDETTDETPGPAEGPDVDRTPPADAATLVRLTRIAELTRLRCGGRWRPLPGLRSPSPTEAATPARD